MAAPTKPIQKSRTTQNVLAGGGISAGAVIAIFNLLGIEVTPEVATLIAAALTPVVSRGVSWARDKIAGWFK